MAAPNLTADLDAAWRNFIPLQKVIAAAHEVWGAMVTEIPDEDGEILDYPSSKLLIEAWSATFAERTGGKSLGNVRLMHQKRVVGKVIALRCDDVSKAVLVGVKVTDPAIWADIEDGLYTGFSIGGRRAGRPWPDPGNPRLYRYTARPLELSIVDNPCIPDATFALVKAGGATTLRKFATVEKAPMDPTQTEEAEQTPVTAHDAAVEERADAEADHDPTVAVPVDVIAEWHRILVALGAHWASDPAANPLDYLLTTLHAGFCAYCPDCCDGTSGMPVAAMMMDQGLEQSADAGDLAKAGKRLSAASLLHVSAVHAHAHALLGAGAHPDEQGGEDAAGDAVQKAADEAAPSLSLPEQLLVVTPTPTPEEWTAVQERIADLETRLTKAADAQSAQETTHSAQVAGLTAEIAKLAAMPMPGGPVLTPGGGGPVEKTMGGEPGLPAGASALQIKITQLEAAYAAEAVPVAKARIGRDLMAARDDLRTLTGVR